MKAVIPLELRKFPIPAGVEVSLAPIGGAPPVPPRPPGGFVPPGEPPSVAFQAVSGMVRLQDIPAEDLAILCDEFRSDVFMRAGKKPPSFGSVGAQAWEEMRYIVENALHPPQATIDDGEEVKGDIAAVDVHELRVALERVEAILSRTIPPEL